VGAFFFLASGLHHTQTTWRLYWTVSNLEEGSNDGKEKQTMTRRESLGPEEGVRASDKYEEWFSELSPLQQATYLLMEKICALNMGVTEALIGLDSPDTLRIVAEDLKFHIDRFLSAFNENMRGER
jgi:hypothetical protein